MGGEGGVGGVWDVGCERGGSEEERMDKILLVIGKKRGRESEREGEKVGKEVGRGERGRSCNIFVVTLLYLGEEGGSK